MYMYTETVCSYKIATLIHYKELQYILSVSSLVRWKLTENKSVRRPGGGGHLG